LASRDEEFLSFVRDARRSVGSYTWYGTLPEAFSLVMGFLNAHDKSKLREFQDWIGKRRGRPELAFVVHAMNEAFPDRTDRSGLSLSKEQNEKAVDVLFALLEAFLSGEPPESPLS
jgi:hypothetical protein